MKGILAGALLLALPLLSQTQKNEKLPRYFGEAIAIDSSSTVLIPTRYNADLLSSNKLALWHDFYANVIFYDMSTDTYKKLFETDTYIRQFTRERNPIPDSRPEGNPARLNNTSRNWIFYFVKPGDYNKNGRIDNDDPSVLYVSNKAGNKIRALTPEQENAVSMEVYDKQGFALVKMQRDSDNNKRFEGKDRDFYYIRLNLADLALGQKIELNP
ncbi:hypothetical protein [Pontibacter roseus]|uniref:hypothetical protein n=1 Tax=Pontibacter roseus TaxID=336989 RepID=UPI00037AD622|nr:hypothetical protein [Pontibacter roseus]